MTKPTVLIVDDVDANLIALRAQLDRLECDIIQARSANEALKLLLQHELAVVLLDVQMPDMDGFEVARLARSNPATAAVPIIFVTAMHATRENALRGYGSGAVDLLFKPIDPVILRSKVAVFVELHRSRRRLADEIESHKRTLADLEAFNYSISHDLRAPLRRVEHFSEALLDSYGGEIAGRVAEYLQRIRGGARRMSQLLDDLMRLSRVGRASMRRERVDLAALGDAIIGELRESEPERHVDYVVSARDAVVDGDPGLLRIALDNLLRNAWKFTRERPEARIELGARCARGRRMFFVRDNGAGFADEHAGKLFQPFQRLHDDSEFEGTGIGLAIVARVMRRHHGTVRAESSLGEGATFYFTL